MASKIKFSETVVIKRSQIKFASYNPKNHKDKDVQEQLSNFRAIGFLGGIVWNPLTGNLVSGHKRVMALDIYYKYDGNISNDYELKVEQKEMTENEEIEQNIYMNSHDVQTPFDNKKLSDLINKGINVNKAGLSENTINIIKIDFPIINKSSEKPTLKIQEEFNKIQNETSDEIDNKEHKKAIHKIRDQIKEERNNEKSQSPFIVITFDNFENKAFFMENKGLEVYEKYVRGEQLFKELFE